MVASSNGEADRYRHAVEDLARTHAQEERSIVRILSVPDPDAKVIRLIEVFEEELPPEGDVLVAYGFRPSQDLPYQLEIALVSIKDWERVVSGALSLPATWNDPGGPQVVWERN